MKVFKWIFNAKKKLVNSSTPQLDAELLICYVLKYSKKELFLNSMRIIKFNNLLVLRYLLNRRILGEPIEYIINKKDFWSFSLFISSSVLIPRPDTEIIVEQILLKVSLNFKLVLDLGTGSGAIALAIATEFPQCKVIGTDNNLNALSIARYNAKQLNKKNTIFVYSDWFSHLPCKKFHVIVCNPPYLSEQDFNNSFTNLIFEPYNALVSGKTGIECIQYIIENSCFYLIDGGWLYIEHCYKQTNIVQRIFKNNFFIKISSIKDYSNCNRVTYGCFKKKG
ncbi:Release factor glutamine methyltransferase [Buchnera aphidicola (Cinara cuneomaculata)]|uniref:peptide chain release factor N(5)-glutamine methyltransferase n=1 Tax=Buchnera aphidicola (Cinara cuneomaculata) TaxID=1660040 RepID=A0A451CXP2_9GAMM|nr:peptide chain release factor N(5)-glutamine methyltransferase [Buchnera aphidicola]VFP78100.1 Release factor glutamine methyltransferase [Buchnera aphidicola (Cinara cuneomaculata)]